MLTFDVWALLYRRQREYRDGLFRSEMLIKLLKEE